MILPFGPSNKLAFCCGGIPKAAGTMDQAVGVCVRWILCMKSLMQSRMVWSKYSRRAISVAWSCLFQAVSVAVKCSVFVLDSGRLTSGLEWWLSSENFSASLWWAKLMYYGGRDLDVGDGMGTFLIMGCLAVKVMLLGMVEVPASLAELTSLVIGCLAA